MLFKEDRNMCDAYGMGSGSWLVWEVTVQTGGRMGTEGVCAANA